MPDFHNPYNFIPAPPPVTDSNAPLGHRKPPGHQCWHKDLWSGRISVSIEAVTPLLIPSAQGISRGASDHKTFDVRMVNGRPHLPVTTLKGALRSAYEAITNSRLGVFEEHSDRLAYRMDVSTGLQMVPARVNGSGAARTLQLFFGSHANGSWPQQHGNTLGPPGGLMYAAWLKRYGPRNGNSNQTTDGLLHRQRVWCRLQRVTRNPEKWTEVPFDFWEVVDLNDDPALLDLAKTAYASPRYTPRPGVFLGPVEGYICETNQNIGKKHDERVFFTTNPAGPLAAGWNAGWDNAWRELIGNYREQAQKPLRRRGATPPWRWLGKGIGDTAFSRHIYAADAERLKDGDLCYALCDTTGGIHGLYPVMVSRELHGLAPGQLLHEKLQPATTLEELSPADRVFGWVGEASGNQRTQAVTQHRGQLRIVDTRFDETCAVANAPLANFPESGLPLAILGAPKPSQSRFYVAENPDGGAQADGRDKGNAGYNQDRGLRGRKVYPHQPPRSAQYWDAGQAMADAQRHMTQTKSAAGVQLPPDPQGQNFREYVRRAGTTAEAGKATVDHEQRDSQNRSIRGWIKPGARFTADIDVTNLNTEELGALLALLTLSDNRCLKLGGGKPLGFGSVKIKLEALDVATGQDKAQSLRALTEPPSRRKSGADAIRWAQTAFVQPFWRALWDAYGDREMDPPRVSLIPFYSAFLAAVQGFGANEAVHYPRLDAWPNPAGENFEWFKENERGNANSPRRKALSDLRVQGTDRLPRYPRPVPKKKPSSG
jgi:CRISPR-associated protein (TIGR03986 family)